jgi:hypothetical protein
VVVAAAEHRSPEKLGVVMVADAVARQPLGL